MLGRTRPPDETESDTLEALICFAQTHFSQDFTNSQREDCPEPEVLTDLLQKGRLPDDDLRAHLFSCSKCYQDFRIAVEAQKTRQARELIPFRKRTASGFRLRPAWAVLVLILIVFPGLLAIYVIKHRQATQVDSAMQKAGPNTLAASPQATPESESKQLNPAPTSAEARKAPAPRDLIATNSIHIDLEAINRSRDGAETPVPLSVLRPAYAQLTIKLPSGSPVGLYDVSFADAFGKPIRVVSSRSTNSLMLHLSFNLESVKEGNYLICITLREEVPDCVPVMVKAH
jgi:hypothetical protein